MSRALLDLMVEPVCRGPFALLEYRNSYNLGDDIQSIAAQRLIGDEADGSLRVDRDSPPLESPVSGQNVKIIYNGWFDGQYCHFPPNYVDPLFVSFHINETNHDSDPSYSMLEKVDKFRSIAENVAYLKQYEPIGCRDYHTMRLLESKGISAYFSGCLTLTLENPFSIRTEEILVVDAHIQCPELFARLVPPELQQQAIYISQALRTLLPTSVKHEMALRFLDRLAQARLVITSRLHTALPCLAFGTPVIFLNTNLEDPRFDGLLPFLKAYGPRDEWDLDWMTFRNPPNRELERLRVRLVSTVMDWLFVSRSPRPGTSIVTACMDRAYVLEQTLPTWVEANPAEIIVVDWGSKKSLGALMSRFPNTNIVLIRVNGVDKWVLSKAYNLGVRMASYTNILKLDADIRLDRDFFCRHNLEGKKGVRIFFAGNWAKSRNQNETHTNGTVYLSGQDFREVGGYNEYIESYGYDDDDLYGRLTKRGSRRLLLDLDSIHHTPHSNAERVVNQSITPDDTALEIEKNRLLSKLCLWHDGEYSTFQIKTIPNDSNGRLMLYEARLIHSVELEAKIREELTRQALENRRWVKSSWKFYINVRNGLGNRLRALASAYNIAKGSGRKLVVLWIPDFHCEAKFTDLFVKNHLLHEVELIESADDFDLSVFQHGSSFIESSCLPLPDPNRSTNQVYDYERHKGQYIVTAQPGNIYVQSACVLSSELTSWNKEVAFLRALQPVDSLMAQIFAFDLAQSCSGLIGIHIRMGQTPTEHRWDYVEQYDPVSKASVKQWRSNSHWTVFLGEMRRIVQKEPKQRFLVCCDNPEAWTTLHEALPDNVLGLQRSLADRSVDQVKTAVVDIWLLAKTKSLLGSNWSSFTELISRLSGKTPKLAGVDF